MSVNVKGRNIDVTPALKEYVEKKITKVTKQFKTCLLYTSDAADEL